MWEWEHCGGCEGWDTVFVCVTSRDCVRVCVCVQSGMFDRCVRMCKYDCVRVWGLRGGSVCVKVDGKLLKDFVVVVF